jgi:hypothetical protein
MYKIKHVKAILPHSIVCEFDTGTKKILNIQPLLENHAHLEGINLLKNNAIFEKVAVGQMGEVYWENIITTQNKQIWNYDISPEYVFYNGITII